MIQRLAILRDGGHVAGVLTFTNEGTITQDPPGFMGSILGQIKQPEKGLDAIPLAKKLEIFTRVTEHEGFLTLTDAGVIEQEPEGFLTDILDWMKAHTEKGKTLNDVRVWATLEDRMNDQGYLAVPVEY